MLLKCPCSLTSDADARRSRSATFGGMGVAIEREEQLSHQRLLSLSGRSLEAFRVMNIPTSSRVRWLDFSGAPPMLIPKSLAALWRGTTDRATGHYRELNSESPVTDYDRACVAAWPGKSTLEFMGYSLLVLYTEFDLHTWDHQRELVACGGWLPSEDELRRATWTDRINWHAQQTDFMLMNSAATGEMVCATRITCRSGYRQATMLSSIARLKLSMLVVPPIHSRNGCGRIAMLGEQLRWLNESEL